MKIQINTDKNITVNEAMAKHIEETISHILSRFSSQITRLEIHISDENSASKHAGVIDKKCVLEARLAGRKPTAVSDFALTVDQAITGAAHKMVHLLQSELGKISNH